MSKRTLRLTARQAAVAMHWLSSAENATPENAAAMDALYDRMLMVGSPSLSEDEVDCLVTAALCQEHHTDEEDALLDKLGA